MNVVRERSREQMTYVIPVRGYRCAEFRVSRRIQNRKSERSRRFPFLSLSLSLSGNYSEWQSTNNSPCAVEENGDKVARTYMLNKDNNKNAIYIYIYVARPRGIVDRLWKHGGRQADKFSQTWPHILRRSAISISKFLPFFFKHLKKNNIGYYTRATFPFCQPARFSLQQSKI